MCMFDVYFFIEVCYNGIKMVVICLDYFELVKLIDYWLYFKQGIDVVLVFVFGYVILCEFYVDLFLQYFQDYCCQYLDMLMLVCLECCDDGCLVVGCFLCVSELGGLGEVNNLDWKILVYDENSGQIVVFNGLIGFCWGEKGCWNIEEKVSNGVDICLCLSLFDVNDGIEVVSFFYFGGIESDGWIVVLVEEVLDCNILVCWLVMVDGGEMLVVMVYDLLLVQYGVDCGFGGGNVVLSFDDMVLGMLVWQECIIGVLCVEVIEIVCEFVCIVDKIYG